MQTIHTGLLVGLFNLLDTSVFSSFLAGVRFRRQHWCFLSLVILILVLCVSIGLPLSGSGAPGPVIPPTEEARMEMVQQLLTDVPLVDG